MPRRPSPSICWEIGPGCKALVEKASFCHCVQIPNEFGFRTLNALSCPWKLRIKTAINGLLIFGLWCLSASGEIIIFSFLSISKLSLERGASWTQYYALRALFVFDSLQGKATFRDLCFKYFCLCMSSIFCFKTNSKFISIKIT